ncbi:MAG: amidohydrolase family protein [Proteobacteria bacterium]|nr:amidohydrolase family protein [Pseudomonadota bacterium]
MDEVIVRGRYVLTDARRGPAGILDDGAIRVAGGTVAEVGAFAELSARHPAVPVKGNGKQLLMPGLIDAHCHGRGLSPIQKGVRHDYLENALFDWAVMPVLPPELTAGLCAVRRLRSGCTTVHHNGFDSDSPDAAAIAEREIGGYLDSGIRLAFSPGIRNANKLALDEAGFVESLPTDLRTWARSRAIGDGDAMAERYFTVFDRLHQRFDGAETRILLSPSWAHGATDNFLRRTKALADRLGAQIHIHLLQTPIQKAYGLRAHGKPTLAWLDDLGLVDRNVTFGHAIHVTEADIALLAQRGASVTTHPSCNLNMRNGLAPVWHMVQAGVNVAMGMDDKTINDDEDGIMELRMIHKLHRTPDFDLAKPALDAYAVLAMGTVNAARVCGFDGVLGSLAPGMKADAILVDLESVLEDPWLDPDFDIVEAFLHRARGADVNTVVVGGRLVIDDRQWRTIDVPALYAEVRKVAAKGISAAQRQNAEMLQRLKRHAHAWYAGWSEPMLTRPYYAWNSRD